MIFFLLPLTAYLFYMLGRREVKVVREKLERDAKLAADVFKTRIRFLDKVNVDLRSKLESKTRV